VEDLLGMGGVRLIKGGVSGGGVGEEEWEVGRDERASVRLDGAEGGSISRRSNRSFSVDSKAFPTFKSRFCLDLSYRVKNIQKNIDTKYSYTKPKSKTPPLLVFAPNAESKASRQGKTSCCSSKLRETSRMENLFQADPRPCFTPITSHTIQEAPSYLPDSIL